MATIRQVADKIFYETKPSSPDRRAMINFREYLSEKNIENMLPSEFGELQFIDFIKYLSKIKSTKSKYNISIALRRLILMEHNNGVTFQRSPRMWPTPPKPEPTHFEPLSKEQLDILKPFLKQQIDLAYHKEAVVEEAILKGDASRKIGTDFWRRENQDPSLPRFSFWEGNLKDTIATLYSGHPDFPNNATSNMQKEGGKYNVPRDLTYTNLTNPIITIMKRLSMQRIHNFTPFMIDAPELNMSDVIAYLYPDLQEIIALKIAICLETGWSPDITERIDLKDFIYDPIPMEGNWVFIKSAKEKGAAVNTDTNIREQRVMIHPSSKNNTHSAYNLIQLLSKRTSRFRCGISYDKAIEDINTHPAFISLTVNRGMKFVAHHPNRENINRSASNKYIEDKLGFKLDLRQLRPTRLYINDKENNLPLLLQVALFGHSISAITDGVYKENSHFRQLRKDKLAVELDAVFETISDGSFRGSLIPLRQTTNIKQKILNIYTNHNGESPLAICHNPFQPDWDSSRKTGTQTLQTRCKQFNKCLVCSQSSVSSDNIPFVVDRYLYLDQMRRSMRSDQFDSIYRNEYEAVKEVTESWPYQDEIREAELRNAIDGYLLPPVISESY
ncbi:hypothetical protein BCT70_002970 [Vibrio lentus]|uniref:hypothetical protein n=1 Tax=Vibrio lentus TaxID=136468 RepID=UPI000C82849A|nr:hypothetical protein [Vibrio lentus]MCB5460143.1 hypothetical protein [Vibrio lentus]MCC4849315.1 hypothetical protein [Vibrio lentus]MCC5493236.1 hypothetical protein [Vibrio lentus]MCC5530521.1 hypothetical protein [Vibrio lentus]MCC5537037.1 hypothetical protein [Vibrio lentus]